MEKQILNLPGVKYNRIDIYTKSLKFIRRQTKINCFYAICKDSFNIRYVKDQTMDLCNLAFKSYTVQTLLVHIRKQTEKICLLSIKNGIAESFAYFTNRSRDITIKALKINGCVIQFIKNKTLEYCKYAVMSNGYAIKYITNQTEDLCITALKTTPNAIDFINIMTYDICKFALSLGYCSVISRYQNDELCKMALRINPRAIDYIHDKKEEYCLYVVGIDYRLISSIENPSPAVKKLAFETMQKKIGIIA